MRSENPRELSDAAIKQLILEDYCPLCLSELDTGWECNNPICCYDAKPLGIRVGATKL